MAIRISFDRTEPPAGGRLSGARVAWPHMATPPLPRLRGREEELQALGESFDQAASGHLTIAVVEGRQASARPGCLPTPFWGFARFGRQPSWTSQWGTGATSAR